MNVFLFVCKFLSFAGLLLLLSVGFVRAVAVEVVVGVVVVAIVVVAAIVSST